jgi:hypothetical protein
MEHQLQSRDRQNQKAGAGKRARSLVPSFLTAMGLSGLFERERCTLALPIEWEVGCKKCACIKRWRLTTFDDRDPRRYPEPNRFDISRGSADHMGFGQGTHMCAGMHLARMEITAVLQALTATVSEFVIHKAERRPHNTLRGLHRLETSLIAG